MTNKILSLVSLLAVGASLSACQSRSTRPESHLTIPRTQNNTNQPITVRSVSGTLGNIERLDPALDALLPAGAVIEKLVDDPEASGMACRSSSSPADTAVRRRAAENPGPTV